MAEVFAGFVTGYIVALVSTPLLAVLLLRLRAESALLARLLPVGTSALSIAVVLHGALFFVWTGSGILLGLVLLAMEDSPGGLGSLNLAYSLFVLGLTIAVLAPVAIVSVRLRPTALASWLVLVFGFGWLMPYLAEWSTFGP